jgi:hypothetical protein
VNSCIKYNVHKHNGTIQCHPWLVEGAYLLLRGQQGVFGLKLIAYVSLYIYPSATSRHYGLRMVQVFFSRDLHSVGLKEFSNVLFITYFSFLNFVFCLGSVESRNRLPLFYYWYLALLSEISK